MPETIHEELHQLVIRFRWYRWLSRNVTRVNRERLYDLSRLLRQHVPLWDERPENKDREFQMSVWYR